MQPEIAAGGLALAAILAYAVLAGADFGGGVWDFLAAGPRKREQREAIGEAMGPVWETNHVWLIYVLVLLFTCFPPVFAVLGISLFAPLTLALIGIVLRGAAFAFRGPANRNLLPHKIWGVIFGIASLSTPFLFGACAGGIASGSFGWQRPMSLTVGVFAVALCAQLAAVFLSAETRGPLRDDFRRHGYRSTLAVAATGLAALIAGWLTEPRLIAHLRSPVAVAAVACAMALGVVVLFALRADRARLARVAVAAEVACVVCGWYAAQAPFALAQLGVLRPAAPAATIVVFLWTSAAGAIVLLPSLALLFAVFKRVPIES